MNKIQKGFTLAEVLITLGIIGVVAALTMPALITNYQKRNDVLRLKKEYSVLSQVVEMAKKDHGDIPDWDWSLSADDFFNTYFVPYLNVLENCHTGTGCWNKDQVIYAPNGNVYENIKSSDYSKVKLVDGSTLALRHDGSHVHIYLDTNGEGRPNTYGHDCYPFTLTYGSLSEYNINKAGLYIYGIGRTRESLVNDCQKTSGFGATCGALYQMDGWEVCKECKL